MSKSGLKRSRGESPFQRGVVVVWVAQALAQALDLLLESLDLCQSLTNRTME